MQDRNSLGRYGLRRSRVSVLLGGVSVLALLASAGPVEARGPQVLGRIVPTQAVQQAATQSAQQAAAAAQQAQASLGRAAAALAIIQQVQGAAAALAGRGTVPDGITAGGLLPQGGATATSSCGLFCTTYQPSTTDSTLWQGANAPQQTVQGGKYSVDITQTQSKAILNWDSFSIGRNTTLNFKQQSSDWIAFNRVNEASIAPSQILGNVNAIGSVYVVNRNGIIFGSGSQVNVHTLIASDLDVGGFGLTRQARDAFFQSTGIGGTGNNNLVFSNTFPVTKDSKGTPGDKIGGGVYVQPGATISTSLLTPDTPGSIFLFGANVFNEGTLISPAGQVALVAAQGIAFTPGKTTASTLPSNVVVDPVNAPTGIRATGFLIQQYSDAYSLSVPTNPRSFSYRAGTGRVVDGGLIQTPRGTVTMNGDTISIEKVSTINIGNVNALTTPDPGKTNVTLASLGSDGLPNPSASVFGVISADTSITRNSMVLLDAATSVSLQGVISIQPYENGETLPMGGSSGSSVQRFLPAFVEMSAQNVVSMEASGLISAPSATVSLLALKNTTLNASPNNSINGRLGAATRQVVLAGADPNDPVNQPGAVIDVAGLQNVVLPATYNFIQYQPRGGEFADAPLQRSGPLFNQQLWIDIRASGKRDDGSSWVGTPLGDASGFVGAVGRSIDQLMTAGGSVTLTAQIDASTVSQVVQGAGSVVSVAGGRVTYQPGWVPATFLIGADGRIYSMDRADPSRQYLGIAGQTIVNHPRWGITQTFVAFNRSYQGGYTDGQDAGSLTVSAVTPQLDGSFFFGSPIGDRQALNKQLPSQGSLTLLLPTSVVTAAGGNLAQTNLVTPDTAVRGQNFVSQSRFQTVLSADALSSFGLSALNITANDLLVTHNPANDAANLPDIQLAAGGSLGVSVGGAIDIAGRVSAPGGSITLNTNRSAYRASGGPFQGAFFAAPTAPNGGAVIAANVFVEGTLDASGRFVNDARGPTPLGAANINGGTISISTTREDANVNSNAEVTGSIVLASGSVLDVSSGGYISQSGKVQTSAPGVMAGAGGAIQLVTYSGADYVDASASGAHAPPVGSPAATIKLGGTLRAYGFTSNGSLSIAGVSTIRIGGTPTAGDGLDLPVCSVNCQAQATTIAGLLGGGGFGAYTFSSLSDSFHGSGNIIVAPGTNLTLIQQNLSSVVDYSAVPTGTPVGATAPLTPALGADQRQPVSLTFQASNITLGQGARIETDPGAKISFAAPPAPGSTSTAAGPATNVLLLGSIFDHSGTVKVNALHTWLGSQSTIDLSGTAIANSRFGFRNETGQSAKLTPGGTLVLDAQSGTSTSLAGSFVVADVGASVDVSGYAGTISVKAANGKVTTLDAWSDAGTVAINTGAFAWGGTLVGLGGRSPVTGLADPRANGATLLLGGGPAFLTNDSSSVVSGLAAATKPASADSLSTLASLGLGQFNGKIQVGVDRITGTAATSTGFENIFLYSGSAPLEAAGIFTDLSTTLAGAAVNTFGNGGTSALNPLTISGSLDWNVASRLHIAASQINATSNNGSVSLAAPYVMLTGGGGTTAAGSNSLKVSATTLLDIEGAALSGFGSASFVSSGDIRLGTPKVSNNGATDPSTFNGTLASGGDLTLTAQRIYPVTAVNFTIQTPGKVTFQSPQGSRTALPLSAGGSITVSAQTIEQNGNLFAPLGKITLGVQGITQTVTLDPGSLTSVTLDGSIVPFGETQDGVSWFYNSVTSPLSAPPAKGIALVGSTVNAMSGSTIDLHGGGDLQAMEFVPGKGGSRDTLAGTPAGGTVYALLPASYAGDPVAPFDVHFTAARSATTPGDPYPLAGTQIHLDGGNGIPAGTYTLASGHYATLPGAMTVSTYYASNLDKATKSGTTLPDGTVLVTGNYTQSTRSGVQSSGQTLFAVRTSDVWKQYSQYNFTGANSYFIRNVPAGRAVPRLPMDAGRLAAVASTNLVLAAIARTQSAQDSQGRPLAYDSSGNLVDPSSAKVFRTATLGELDISSSQLSVVSAATDADPGHLAVTLDTLNNFGSVLIGGLRNDSGLITPTATDVVFDTRGRAFTGPEIILAAQASSGPGTITIRSGSIIDTTQSASSLSTGRSYSDTTTGALFVATNDSNLALTGPTSGTLGAVAVQAGTSITTGTLTLQANKTTGAVVIDSSAALTVNRLNLTGATVGIGASTTDSVQLATTNSRLLARVNNLALRAYSGDITFYRNVGESAVNFVQAGMQSLSLDARSITGTGGNVNIQIGGNIVLLNSGTTTGTSGAPGATGTSLNLTAQQITLGGGSQTIAGFKTVNLAASDHVLVASSGALTLGSTPAALSLPQGVIVSVTQNVPLVFASSSLGGDTLILDVAVTVTSASTGITSQPIAGGTPLQLSKNDIITPLATGRMAIIAGSTTLSFTGVPDAVNVNVATPNILVSGKTATGTGSFSLSTQGTVTTTGSPKLATTDDVGSVGFGGKFTVNASAIAIGTALQAEAGAILLHATSGDVTLGSGGIIAARGYAKTLFDQVVYAPGGKVTLQADQGSVNATVGTIDVSQPTFGQGYGGEVDLLASSGNVNLGGTLLGSGGPGLGGRLKIDSNNAIDLNALVARIQPAGTTPVNFTGSVDVHSRTGNLILAQGTRLTANAVTLTADDRSAGNGAVTIAGTIDATGYSGDSADGMGQAGGQVGLYAANAVVLTRTGIIFASTTHNDERGGDVFINLGATATGKIDLQAGSLIDVTGGTKGGLSGGTLLLRAPLVADASGVAGRGDVSINAIASTISGARSVTIQPYVTFTTNTSLSGTNAGNSIVAVTGWDGNVDPGGAVAGTAGAANHVAFFGTTLANFAQGTWTFNGRSYGFGLPGDAANVGTLNRLVKPLVAALGPGGASIVQLQPGVNLVNPDSTVNGGNITVASNWNLASGSAVNPNGTALANGSNFDVNNTAVKFNYRLVANYGTTANPNLVVNPGALTLGAVGNVNVNASISDGFFQFGDYTGSTYVAQVRTYLGNLASDKRLTGIDPFNLGSNQYLYYVNSYSTTANSTPLPTYKSAGNGVSPTSLDLVGSDLFPHTLIACTGNCTGSNRVTLTDPGSWSYQFTAGANLSSANPASVKPQIAGDVVLKGTQGVSNSATEVQLPVFNSNTGLASDNALVSTYLSTMVRTGTGNIGISAAGDVKLSDQAATSTAAAGVIYAAGVQTAKLPDPGYAVTGAPSAAVVSASNPDGFLEPRLLMYDAKGVDTVFTAKIQTAFGPPTAAAFPYKAGDVSVVAQRDIVGVGDATAASVQDRINNKISPSSTISTFQLFDPWLMSLAGLTPISSPDNASQVSLMGAGVFAPTGNRIASQTSWWIQYNSFQQGILSAGGNVNLAAGRNITDVSVSLPTTGRVSGGLVSPSTGTLSTPVTHVYGSGNMTVRADGNISGGAFYEGSGHASILARGSVGTETPTSTLKARSQFTTATVPDLPLLAVDTGRIALMASGALTFAGVVNPAELHQQAGSFADPQISGGITTPLTFDTYGPDSGVNLVSLAGDVTIRPTPTHNRYSNTTSSGAGNATLYPASLQVAALGGNIVTQAMFTPSVNLVLPAIAGVNPGIHLSQSVAGVFDLLANGSVDLTGGYTADIALANATVRVPVTVPTFSAGPSLIDAAFDPYHPNSGFNEAFSRAVLAQSLVFDKQIARIYAANGNITGVGSYTVVSPSTTPAFVGYRRIEINRPTVVRAGGDIVNLNLIVQNIGAGMVSTISAGGDITYAVNDSKGVSRTGLFNAGGIQVAGPGSLVVQAGGNIGPFLSLSTDTSTTALVQEGIASVGNASQTPVGNLSASTNQAWSQNNATGIYDSALLGSYAPIAKKRNEQLPSTGANIVTLFGVKYGIDYQAVIDNYIDPGIASGVAHKYTSELSQFLTEIGIQISDPRITPWIVFHDLLPLLPQGKDLQQLFVDRVFFSELKAVGTPGSYAYNKPSFGYRMIETMFPARLGYTNNTVGSSGSGANASTTVDTIVNTNFGSITVTNVLSTGAGGGATTLVHTGDLNLLHATIQTQRGGSISLFGPGGSIIVGSLATEPNPNLKLRDLGILSLGGGAINSFTDKDLLVNASRILTVLGGDILAWSSNGDLDAGRGARNVQSLPPLNVAFDSNNYQSVDASGLVTGSGIAVLQSTSFANTSNAILLAPRGVIDAGDAGIRSSGTVFLLAPVVLNQGSITANQGSNLPTVQAPNVGAITSASSSTGAQSKVEPDTKSGNRDRASIFQVEVIGYGGGDSGGNSGGSSSGSSDQGVKKQEPAN